MQNNPFLQQYLQREFLIQHTQRLISSYQHWLSKPLLPMADAQDPVPALMHAPYAIASHAQADDPCFNYVNLRALALFKMTPEQMLGLPSRYSAEPMLREARANFLARVAQQGFVEDYAGVRIAQDGSRFEIQGATVWNVIDVQQPELGVLGQAVIIRSIRPLLD